MQIPTERDLPFYYPIAIDLEYRLRSRGAVMRRGRDRTTRLSSNRVEFVSGDELPPEMTVEIFIQWPARLNNAVSLQLYVLGQTLRSSDHCITVEIQRYEFRTRRERSPMVAQTEPRSRANAASA